MKEGRIDPIEANNLEKWFLEFPRAKIHCIVFYWCEHPVYINLHSRCIPNNNKTYDGNMNERAKEKTTERLQRRFFSAFYVCVRVCFFFIENVHKKALKRDSRSAYYTCEWNNRKKACLHLYTRTMSVRSYSYFALGIYTWKYVPNTATFPQ